MKFLNIKKDKNEDPNNSHNINIRRIVSVFVVLVLIVGIIVYTGVQIKGFYDRISQNFQEIKFAYEKPNLVKSMRENYQQKQKELEESFLKKEKTAEQKLLEEVTEQLKQSKK